MSKLFDFNEQLAIGEQGENEVYEILTEHGYTVDPVKDILLQKRGIDAFIYKANVHWSLEVKTDLRALKTGNCFLETDIVSEKELKPGWLYKTTAQLIGYYVPGSAIHFFETSDLRRSVLSGHGRFYKGVGNKGWSANGHIFPIEKLVENPNSWSILL